MRKSFYINIPDKFPEILLLISIFLIFYLPILKYNSLHSFYFDLGVFQNTIYNATFNHDIIYKGHFQPLIIPTSYLYKILNISIRPYLLIFLNSLAIIFSVLIISRCYSKILGVIFCLYAPVWFNVLNDFHFDIFIIPITLLFYAFCRRKMFLCAFVISISMIFIKEVYALSTVGCGLYMVFEYYKNQSKNLQQILFGCLLIVIGMLGFYLIVFVILPIYNRSESLAVNSTAFSWIGGSPIEIILNIINNPLYFLSEIFTVKKMKYITLLLGSLLFIPLLSIRHLIPLVLILMISLISMSENYYSFNNHYTSGLIAPLIISCYYGLNKLSNKLSNKLLTSKNILISLVIVNYFFSPSPLSRLFYSTKVWSYSYQAYFSSTRIDMIKEALYKYIPADPNISVSTQNSINFWYLAERFSYLPFPIGTDNSNSENTPYADYVVIDINRPLYLNDKGCMFLYNSCNDIIIERSFMILFNALLKSYENIYENDNFYIFKRKI